VPPVKSLSLGERFRGCDISIEALDLLQRMLTFDPIQRITAFDALQHKYFLGANYSDVHRTCPYSTELIDDEIPRFQIQCGGL